MLCNACVDLFSAVGLYPPGVWVGTRPILFDYAKLPNAWTGSHYIKAGDFIEAVERNCYICRTLYRDCSPELRKQARLFRTFYQFREIDSDNLLGRPGDHYELEFTTEILDGEEPIARQQVFNCKGRFKVIPKSEVSSSGVPLGLTENTFSGKCERQVRQWLENCCRVHERCNQDWRTGAGSPSRLLHINPDSGEQLEFRLEIFAHGGPPPKYVTLSHCWGAGTAVTLTTDSQQHLLEWSPISSLPKRFQDAMKIAKWIGVEYIWIDALCIIQNSEFDWLAESAKMGDIYTNSMCNIAATSINPHKGCFTERAVHLVEPYPLQNPRFHGGETNFIIGYDDFWGNSLLDTTLHTRGWVLQERLLSPRTIHFGQEQIFWECRCEMACEAYPDGIPEPFRNRKTHSWRQADKIFDPENKHQSASILQLLSRLKLNMLIKIPKKEPNWVYEIWSKIVEAYMECNLTYSEDKLVAISGIAQKVFEATNERYLAGLWDNGTLPLSLLWYVPRRRQANKTPSVRTASVGSPGYRAPSWSWATLEAKIVWNWPVKCDKVLISILSTRVEQCKGSELARVSSAQMHISGHLFQACLQITNEDEYGVPEENGQYTLTVDRVVESSPNSFETQKYSMEPTVYLDTPMMPNYSSMDVVMLPICTEWQGRSGIGKTPLAGMLLKKKQASSTTTQETYERIGIFGLDSIQACAMCGMDPSHNASAENELKGVRRTDLLVV